MYIHTVLPGFDSNIINVFVVLFDNFGTIFFPQCRKFDQTLFNFGIFVRYLEATEMLRSGKVK